MNLKGRGWEGPLKKKTSRGSIHFIGNEGGGFLTVMLLPGGMGVDPEGHFFVEHVSRILC